MNGRVYLVGAGPGDNKLITVRGRELIERADVIIYDYLSDSGLLHWSKCGAELIYAGKRADQHTLEQKEINQLLVEKALSGKQVVRLKGGDPFVFGRGGEEALALVGAGIPFEIVPGVTSVVGGPAYAGIPITHRGIASSCAIITGHEETVKASGVHWEKLATGADTLVFVMAVHNLAFIMEKLVKYGRSKMTPVAIIRWGTKPEQEVLISTVANAAAAAERNGLKPPAIIVVGEVVNLRIKLQWFEKRPLYGKKALILRDKERGDQFAVLWENLGAEAVQMPVIRIEQTENINEKNKMIADLPGYDWLVFTSVTGVDCFFKVLAANGKDVRTLGHVKIGAIGKKTAEALYSYGFRADVVPGEYCGEALALAIQPYITAGMKILIPRAQEARSVLPDLLAVAGAAVTVVPVYRTVKESAYEKLLRQLLQNGSIDIIPFTSPSTVGYFLSIVGGLDWQRGGKTITAAIGPVTAAACRKNGFNPTVVASQYTLDGICEAVRQYIE